MTLRLIIVISLVAVTSCKKKDDEVSVSETVAHQLGDVMASIDETGGQSGSFAMATEAKTFAKYVPQNRIRLLVSNLLPKAEAGVCTIAGTFGSCTNNVITRNFSSCTIGSYVFTGTVTLTYDDASVDNTCSLAADGNSISRNPNFTITGPQGGTYTVSKTGSYGQKLTRSSSGVFAFSNDGIRRVVSYRGTTIADFTTSTTSDIGVTGTSRSGRVVNGGTLRVQNNLNSNSCSFSPSQLTWSSTCNCPTSGSWSGSCSDGKSGTLTITGCGTGSMNLGGSTENVTFDRCYGI